MRNDWKRGMRFFVWGLFWVMILWGVPCLAEGEIRIDRTGLLPGVPVQVTVDLDLPQDGLLYRWYLDDELQLEGTEPYTPAEEAYGHWIRVEVYSGEEVAGSDEVFFSRLPVIYLDTEDGEAVADKENYKSGSMYIQGNEQFPSQYNGGIQIKGRGNSSWSFPQKAYKLKLDKSTDLFGFGKNKHWVLISSYLDQCLMRNQTAYDLAGRLGLVQMQYTWVDVVINGSYEGSYGLCEHIRVGKSRIPIFDWKDEIEKIAKAVYKANKDTMPKDADKEIETLLEEDLGWITTGEFTYQDAVWHIRDYYDFSMDLSGGYIFELSEEYDEISRFTTDGGIKVMVNTPEYACTNEEMFGYAVQLWQNYEAAIGSLDGYNADGMHYQDLADLDSMVSYWLVMEIMGNDDAWFKSRYAYKDRDGKLIFGPAWDFDWGCGTCAMEVDPCGWKLSHGSLWRDFIDDPLFCVRAAEKYWQIRGVLEELVCDGGVLDQNYEYLKESGWASEMRWPGSDLGRRGFDGDFAAFRDYMRERLEWLDAQFATADSIVESLYMPGCSSAAYTREKDRLVISMEDVLEDTASQHIAADGVYEQGKDLAIRVSVPDILTEQVGVYVNGTKIIEVPVVDGGIETEIPAEAFAAESGVRNVISLIGRYGEGEPTCTNFVTLITAERLERELAIFEYPSGEYGVKISPDGACPATGGRFAGACALTASVDGSVKSTLAYSRPEYRDGEEDGAAALMMRASGKQPWNDGAYYEIKCSTRGFQDLAFSASLGAAGEAPVEYRLQYSLDHAVWKTITGSEAGLSDFGVLEPLYDRFSLPEECGDANVLYIRIRAVFDTDEDGNSIAGAVEGEGVIHHVRLTGVKTDRIYADYKEAVEETAALVEDDYTDFRPVRAALEQNVYREGIGQKEIDEAVHAIRQAIDGLSRKCDYTIQFYSQGGQEVDTLTVREGDPVPAFGATTRTGYMFTGWYTDSECTRVFTQEEMPAENIEVYAGWELLHYTLSFEEEGGSTVEDREYAYGEKLCVPEAPYREGYTFTGWYPDGAPEIPYIFRTMPAESIVLRAGWSVDTYTIHFESNGGSTVADMSAAFGSRIHAPEKPEREGYSFGGWYGDRKLVTAYQFTTMPAQDQILYAKWNANTYTMHFECNGGSKMADKKERYEAELTAPAEPKREGYDFDGWYADEELETPYEFAAMPAKDQTVYAKWSVKSYTLRFESNGGSSVADLTAAYGTAVEAPAAPEREGYTFDGWYSDRKLDTAYEFTTMPAKEKTLYAKWTVNPYTLHFESNGGSSVADLTAARGAAVEAPAAPVREGYTFDGWYSDRRLKKAYEFTVMPAEDQTLYAGWKANSYIMHFESNGGSDVPDRTESYGTKLSAPAAPEREGYAFDGWYSDPGMETRYEFTVMPAGDFTLYAKWKVKSFTLRFISNGGSDVPEVAALYGSELKAPEAPVKDGYVFDGWYSDRKLETAYDFRTMPAKDVTIYAKWKLAAYHVTIQTGISGTRTSAEAVYGQEPEWEAPVREGYTFTGWYTDKACRQPYDPDKIYKSDVTLYAGWKVKEYTVKWVDYDGRVIKTEKVAYGGSGKKPSDPKRAGYTFIGWSSDANKIDASLTVEAMYERIDIALSATYQNPVKNYEAELVTAANPEEIVLYTEAFDKAQLAAKVTGTKHSVKWASSDPQIVSVSVTGRVTAKAAGVAVVTAEADGTAARCRVVVRKAELRLRLKGKAVKKHRITLKKGKKYRLKVQAVPYGVANYKVKNPKMLRVSSKGKLTALCKGSTTITITVNGMKEILKVRIK